MRVSLLIALCLSATPAFADGPSASPMSAHKVRDHLWLLSGPGGNIALVVGPDAVFLVDDQVQPMTPLVKAEIAKVTDKPVRFVINTHWHGDHTGGNPAFAEAGAVIVAHDNVRKRMSTDQFIAVMKKKVPAAPARALPVITFAESLTLHLNGDDIEVFHVAPAHTDGDSLVRFVKDDVIHMGDVLVTSGYPFIDRSSGGHIDGFIGAAERVLAIAGDKTRIIPGHGPISDRAGLTRWRDLLRTIRDRIAKLVAEKKTLAEVIAAHPTAEFDVERKGDFIKPDALVTAIYEDLSERR
jgi:glyoxylase-like metal-dependent hydrolase (beta-lactamase superfamily II)